MITSFSMYIPFFHLFYTLIMVSSLSEFVSCVNDDGVRAGSCVFAALIIIGATLVLACVTWQFFKSQYNFTFLRMKYFRQLFNGLRVNWQSRSYALAVFIRKYLIIMILVLLYQVNVTYRLYTVTAVQLVYLIGLCVCLPF
jgi:hypothetical protein